MIIAEYDAILEQEREAFHNYQSNYTYMLFAGWEVRIVKNCDRDLENAARGRSLESEVTVFHYTDRP